MRFFVYRADRVWAPVALLRKRCIVHSFLYAHGARVSEELHRRTLAIPYGVGVKLSFHY